LAIAWVDTAKGVSDLVQAFALLAGGTWAYFKFARGRTFAYRGQLSIEGHPVRTGSLCALQARLVFENTGASQIPLSETVKIVWVYVATAASWEGRHGIDWQGSILTSQIFRDHQWVEPKEPIVEDVLLPIPDKVDSTPVLAYRLEAVVGSRRRRGKAMKWTAQGLVLDDSFESGWEDPTSANGTHRGRLRTTGISRSG
jgi:hypothetical protein